LDEFIQKCAVPPDRKAFNILENKVSGLQIRDDPQKLSNQLVAWIVKRPLTDHREALAWSSSKNYVNWPSANISGSSDFCATESDDGPRHHRAMWEIIFVNCRMNRVDFNGGDNVETRLLES
jgi:hypothetical protein